MPKRGPMQRSLPGVSRQFWLLTALLLTASLVLPLMAFGQSVQNSAPPNPVQKTWTMTPTLTGQTAPLYSIKDKYISPGFKEAEDVKLPPGCRTQLQRIHSSRTKLSRHPSGQWWV